MKEIIEWHKVVTRPLTKKEIADYTKRGYQDYELPEYAFNCPLPDDGQEILVATKWGIYADICTYDCNDVDTLYGLERSGDWDDVLAWAAMPKYEVNEGFADFLAV